MKKKFINGLLLVAVFLGVTSSMVSCRDYDDEKIGNLEGIIINNEAELRDLINGNTAALNRRIDSLNSILAQCQTNCSTFQVNIYKTLEKYVTYTKLDSINDSLGNVYYTHISDTLKQYYTINQVYSKRQIDSIFGTYYTKQQVNDSLKALRDTLTKIINSKTSEEAIAQLIGDSKTTLEQVIQTLITNNYQTIVHNANGVTKDTIDSIVNAALNNLTPGLTKDEVSKIIADSLAKLNLGINEDRVKELIHDSINGLASEEWVKSLVSDSLKGFATEEWVKKLVNDSVVKLTLYIDNSIKLVQAQVEAAQKLAERDSVRINALDLKVTNLTTSLSNLKDSLGQEIINVNNKVAAAQDSANNALAAAKANSALIQALQENYNDLAERLDAVEGDVSTLQGDVSGLKDDVSTLRTMIDDANDAIDALKEQVEADEKAAKELHDQMLETISGLASSIDTIVESVGDLRDAFDEMGEEVADLQDKAEELQDSIDEHTSQIADLMKEVEKIKNAMAKFISGITLNGTNNPMFGEFSLPVGVRSNVLIAFHGSLDDKGLEFPTTETQFYALQNKRQWEMITAKDIEMIGALESVPGYITIGGNQNIVAGQDASGNVKEGNAGTLYLTVNPTNRDFTGTQFDIINSQNQTSQVTLSDLQRSNKTLTWGYSRGAGPADQSGNGFYEAKATFSLDAVNNYVERMNINLGSLKSVAQDLRNWYSSHSFNLTNLGNAVYENIHEVLEAKAVKATWDDTMSVVSPYDLAVTTVKPLGFAFAKDVEFTHIPGTYRAEEFIDRLLDKVKIALPTLKEFTFDINSIQLAELDPDMIAKFVVNIDTTLLRNIVGYDTNGDPIYANEGQDFTGTASNGSTVTVHIASQNFTITYDLRDEIQQIYGNVEESVDVLKGKIQEMLDDINAYIAELSNSIGSADFTADIKAQLHKYINALNNRFSRFYKPNNFVQPVLLAKNNGRYQLMSTSANYPSRVVASELQLAPTTYTGEILSPCFKKFVAITNVSKDGKSAKDGDSSCKAILDQANAQAQMRQVIDGDMESFIKFNAQQGYTYEVLYTAVDYFGKVAASKYYFTVR